MLNNILIKITKFFEENKEKSKDKGKERFTERAKVPFNIGLHS